MLVLRDYQKKAVESIFNEKQGNLIVALPTGTGKSLIIGAFIKEQFAKNPQSKILILTHVKELISQNKKALLNLWPAAPVGVFSAGLKQKEANYPITFGGIASVKGKEAIFGHQDFVLVDECHSIPNRNNAVYNKFFDGLKKYNPDVRLIGFTATQYRLDSGHLLDSKIFNKICYDLTDNKGFDHLIKHKYLSPLVTHKTIQRLNVSAVKKSSNGEYNLKQLERVVNKDYLTEAVLREAIKFGSDRKAWLVFTSGVRHADASAKILNKLGIKAAAVHNKTGNRDEILKQFKNQELQAVTNNNILTTGFDYPEIDFILILRPTMSTGLWVQMLGRGTRPAPGKENCLVMDFTDNTSRLGTIDDPVINVIRNKLISSTAPKKVCLSCGAVSQTSSKFCLVCKAEYPSPEKMIKIFKKPSTKEVMGTRSGKENITKTLRVLRVNYTKHYKPGRPESLKVSYYCDNQRAYLKWVCLEHSGYARKVAADFWLAATRDPNDHVPSTVNQALARLHNLKTPEYIRVEESWHNYPKILEEYY